MNEPYLLLGENINEVSGTTRRVLGKSESLEAIIALYHRTLYSNPKKPIFGTIVKVIDWEAKEKQS